MANEDYKAAYERQRQARMLAEELLENRSRELFEANQSLQYAYNKLKNQKQQIIHQEKLASIGQLSAGVAHEINNPMAYVKSNLTTLARYAQQLNAFYESLENTIKNSCEPTDSECLSHPLLVGVQSLKQRFDVDYLLNDITDIVSDCQDGVARIEGIVKSLKEFSRPEEAKSEVFSVNQCLDTALKLASSSTKQMTVDVRADQIFYVAGHPGSLAQVFLNMIVNASHATNGEGALQVSLQAQNTLVNIRFKDNGCGISEAVRSKIFDPFFTTKPQGQGTGLGLSISHGIIKKHGGIISVDSEEGVGTEFLIQLPLADDPIISS